MDQSEGSIKCEAIYRPTRPDKLSSEILIPTRTK